MLTRLTIIIVVVVVVLAPGCRQTPLSPFTVDGTGTDERIVSDMESAGGSPIQAVGHFRRQIVERVDLSGNVSTASFQANFVIFDDGKARGSFSLFAAAGMTVYQITSGFLRCEDGKNVAVLTTTVQGPDARVGGTVVATATPSDGAEECLIWELDAGGAYEAEGKFDVLASKCSTGP